MSAVAAARETSDQGSRWIDFREVKAPSGQVTRRWDVVTRVDIHTAHITGKEPRVVGRVKWHGAWRRYCFFAEPNTLFDHECLRTLAYFCEAQTKERRARRRAA